MVSDGSPPILRPIVIPKSLDMIVMRLAVRAGVSKSDMLVSLLEEGLEMHREADSRKVLSRVDYMIVATAALIDPALVGVLSRNGAAHMTVCPTCYVDDFCHAEPCPMLYELDEIGKTI